jgi:hypothetical protein
MQNEEPNLIITHVYMPPYLNINWKQNVSDNISLKYQLALLVSLEVLQTNCILFLTPRSYIY